MFIIILSKQQRGSMKRNELIRELEQLGAAFKEGAKHTKVYLNGKQTTIPRHTEVKEGTVRAIKKQLGI